MAENDPRHLELHCLGAPSVSVDGGAPPADVLWRKHVALLVYLALSPDRSRSRDHLMGLLWPEKPQEHARHSLNEAVRRLRTSLGAARLVSRADTLTLSSESLEVDVDRVVALSETDPGQAAKLFRGEFLEGFSLKDAPAFEEWASLQRSELQRRASAMWLSEGERAIRETRLVDAREAASRVAAVEPYSESAIVLLIRALALAGDQASALSAYHAFEQRLNADLGEEPSRELRDLVDRVRSERWRRVARKYAELDPPLVGRTAVCSEVFAGIEQGLRAGPLSVLILGDAGMGKTRLINESLERLALQGAVVCVARPLESDQDTPWSTLRLLMRGGVVGAPGLAGADPAALAILANIVPELAERYASRQPMDAGHVVGALRSVLGAVAEEQPIAIAIDNAHFADGQTLEALGAVVRELANVPVVLLVAADPGNAFGAIELSRFRAEVGRGIAGSCVRLDPLGNDDISALVTAMAPWCTSSEQRDRLARRIGHEAGGNPLLAVTLLQHLDYAPTLKEDLAAWPPENKTYESDLPFTVPDLARMAVVARISQLDDMALQVLRVASIGGDALDTALIATLAHITNAQVDEALDRLERHRFVRHDGVRYVFTAPLVARVVRGECMAGGQRRRLRRQAAAELATRNDIESRVLRAELLAKAEPAAGTFDEAIATARAAIDAKAGRAARRALAVAEQMADAGDRRQSNAVRDLRDALSQGTTA